ncbi:MAG: hypothetical protein GXY38_09605 [Planctomycetes bacterium]|jgi:hypothetical protein|nr:hypothetical protein [Planctomycetota bacterium]
MLKMASVLLVLAMACGVAFAADANEKAAIQSAVQKAMAQYEEGKVQDAIASLQEAISIMQTSGQKSMAAFFPAAPEGWTKGKVESQSLTSNGLNFNEITCIYTRSSDSAEVHMQLCNSPQMIETHQAVAEAYKNPQMLAAINQSGQMKISQFSKDGWIGWTKVEPDQGAELVSFNGGNLLSIRCDQSDEGMLKQFVGMMNFKAMAEQSIGR